MAAPAAPEPAPADPPGPTPSRSNSFGRNLLAALVWVVLLLVVAVAVNPDGAERAGELFGRFFVAGLLAALVGWLITRRRRPWPYWRLVLLALPFFLLFRLLAEAGQASG